jgi:ATP:ADP antiporter, AAA family
LTTPPSGERAAARVAAAAAGLLIAQLVAGRAVRDALFLSAFPVASLPAMMLASAVASIAAALAFAGALGRRAPRTVVAWTLAASAVAFVAEWRFAAAQPRAVAAAVYLQLALLGPGAASAFWSAVSERFDPHTARRVMGGIGTGAAVGGALGGVLAWAGTRFFPVPALLLGLSAANILVLAVLRRLGPAPAQGERPAETPSGLRAGLLGIREFSYLGQLAALVALGAFAEALLDYVLKAGAARAYADGRELAAFFSLFYAGVALLTLVLQVVASRRALERLGLSGTAALQPFGVALASAVGLALPTLATAVVARGLGSVLRDSLFRSAYELSYTPLPPWRKRPAKALIDVAADKFGSLTGAGVVLALAASPLLSVRGPWLLALVAMAASLTLARRLHRGYVSALEHSLRAGVVAIESEEVVDATTRLTLTRAALDRASVLAEIRALKGEPPEPAPASSSDPLSQAVAVLRSGDAGRIRRLLSASSVPPAELVPLLIPLLARDELFQQVLRALRAVSPRITGQLVDALLDPAQPVVVRRRVPRVLKACPTARSMDGLLLSLADGDFSVRRASGLALAWLQRNSGVAVPAERVHAAVAQELEAPATDVEAQLDHVFALLATVGEPEPLRLSRWALRGDDVRLRGTALEYLEQVLPDAVHQPLVRRFGAARPPVVARPRSLDEVEEDLRRSAARAKPSSIR